MELNSQSRPVDREPVAAGRFYPANRETLESDLSRLFSDCRKIQEERKVRAIVSPHAGYVFSGKVAASAFSSIPANSVYKNIFIIGSSHVMAFDGASVYNTGDFITPLGKAVVNRDIGNRLKSSNKVFDYPTEAHRQDHCLEVQVPFIQYYFDRVPMIVPVIIGTSDEARIKAVAEALRPWFTSENLFVISSDFSHYPSYDDAVDIDNTTATALISGDPEVFLSSLRKNSSKKVPHLSTSMCGWTSGLLLLELINGDRNLDMKRIDYCNSGDSPYGDRDEVVGYHAIAVLEKMRGQDETQGESAELYFTDEEKRMLFSIARNSIKSRLFGDERAYIINEKQVTPALKEKRGAFVTLKVNNTLRGCIGRFLSSDPLFEVVRASALSSAFEDPRFPALKKEEFEKVNIEITVLGPLKKIKDTREIILGKHGIYIKKDFRSGTMLPQVATENNWSVEEFLGYTSRDKAGLGWDGWKNAEIYIYEGQVLEENR
jgi:hypothetical protein